MDKLRALQYFIAAAEAGSLSSAARMLGVSMPAVSKSINALEKDLGVGLFDRSSRGLALTAGGQRYLERCRPLVDELADASASLHPSQGPKGIVVAGLAPFEQSCLAAAWPEFHRRFPEIELDVRRLRRLNEDRAAAADVFVMPGWQEKPDLVRKVVARTPYRIVASPAYWSTHGLPSHPRDLQRHACILYRSVSTVLDVWEFEKEGKVEPIRATGWLSTDDRQVMLDATIAGAGVMRARDLTVQPHESAGRLLGVLEDWDAGEAPPVAVYFRPKHRKSAHIRAFVDFVAEVFRGLQGARSDPSAATKRPAWWDRAGRVSTVGRQGVR